MHELNTKLEAEAAERQTAQEALQASMDELQSFVNIIAHDFRSPMVNLRGFSKELGYSLFELRQVINNEILNLPEKVLEKIDELLDKDVPEAQQFINSAVTD